MSVPCPARTVRSTSNNDFLPKYQVVSAKAKKHIDLLKKEAGQESDELILATDLDREGEAIAWHLLEALGVDEQGKAPRVSRVIFHEITKDRRSPMPWPTRGTSDRGPGRCPAGAFAFSTTWSASTCPRSSGRKSARSLSAGRVQSVALRLICEREARSKPSSPRSTGPSRPSWPTPKERHSPPG